MARKRMYEDSINSSNLRITSSVNKIKLKQLGATVKKIESKIYHVTFTLGNVNLEYYYNINESGKFFLERMEPYYKNFNVFTEENDAIRAIYQDVEYIKNAIKSNNFNKFLELSVEIERLHDAYAEMFLKHNVPNKDLADVEDYLCKIRHRIVELNETTEEIKVKFDI